MVFEIVCDKYRIAELRRKSRQKTSQHCIFIVVNKVVDCCNWFILAEGAIVQPVTLSGGVLIAS